MENNNQAVLVGPIGPLIRRITKLEEALGRIIQILPKDSSNYPDVVCGIALEALRPDLNEINKE